MAPSVQPVDDTARQANVAAEDGQPVPSAMTVAACGLMTQLEIETVVPGYSVTPASKTPQP